MWYDVRRSQSGGTYKFDKFLILTQVLKPHVRTLKGGSGSDQGRTRRRLRNRRSRRRRRRSKVISSISRSGRRASHALLTFDCRQRMKSTALMQMYPPHIP